MTWKDILHLCLTTTSIRCLDGCGFIGPQRHKKEKDDSKMHIVNLKYIDSY